MAHDGAPGFMPPRVEESPADQTPRTGEAVVAHRDAGARPDSGGPTAARTRVWIMLGVGLVLLAAILVFILQNGRRVNVHFLMLHGSLPLGVALLFGVLLGALLVLAIGATRIVRLRRLRRRQPSEHAG